VRPTVFLAGPLAQAPTASQTQQALRLWGKLEQLGFAPFCPQWFHFTAQSYPPDASVWLEQGLIWLEKCDAMLLLSGETRGAEPLLAHAKAHGIPVFNENPVGLRRLARYFEGQNPARKPAPAANGAKEGDKLNY